MAATGLVGLICADEGALSDGLLGVVIASMTVAWVLAELV